MSRGLRILVALAAVLYIGALVAVVYTLAEQQSTDTRLTQQEKFDPCVSLSEAVANKATDRIKPLTRECRDFLSGIGPLVTIKLSCAIIEKARYVCPAPGTERRRDAQRDGVPLGPVLTGTPPIEPAMSDSPAGKPGGRPPRGGQAGGGKQGAARKPRQPKPSEPQPQPSPQPSSSAVPSPAPTPAPEPGNSGQTPAPEAGVKACVDLIVSACVKAEPPHLLP